LTQSSPLNTIFIVVGNATGGNGANFSMTNRAKTMKSVITQMSLLMAALLLAEATTGAQSYTNLYSFSSAGFDTLNNQLTNSDGTEPYSGVVLSSNVLYGTTYAGGTNGYGTVFRLNMDGTDFTNLHTFGDLSFYPGGTNRDGANPHDTLVLTNNVLYGTASEGGSNGYGSVFRLNTDGTGFTNLHSFSLGSDGINPIGKLLVSGNTLYGTASYGGAGSGAGTVFKLSVNGAGYTTLHSFSGGTNDGSLPNGGLVISGSTLYGMTSSGGGSLGKGVIFAMSTNGTGNGSGYTNLYVFTGNSIPATTTTNSSGETPVADLVLSGNTLYGTTPHGGTNGNGIIFAISTNGTGFTNLHTFGFADYDPDGGYTNSDGAYPTCTLILSGNTLYGTTSQGGNQMSVTGSDGSGTVFTINTDGTGFTNLYDFIAIFIINNMISFTGGSGPAAGVILSDNTLYGTTFSGGNVEGNVYAFTLPGAAPVPLNLQVTGGSLKLSWNSPAFSLQSAVNLGGSFSNVPGATSPYTVPATNSQQFFRLQSN
jgi:uncharacterized repeat protein (TIGR03803 family)